MGKAKAMLAMLLVFTGWAAVMLILFTFWLAYSGNAVAIAILSSAGTAVAVLTVYRLGHRDGRRAAAAPDMGALVAGLAEVSKAQGHLIRNATQIQKQQQLTAGQNNGGPDLLGAESLAPGYWAALDGEFEEVE